ncbi:peptide-methionine (R)-S-oxide reductase MsrB [Variovorax sp. RCC_210]|jgi:peptide-methionine (R)-S-oxide reductase|uniref:peptide-methionine (R)-S-oxide reductase MsrB n=1 Tax=Variovorax sp. RCC_210 TaxID=3239217 RepID=UPI000D5E0928
MTPKTGRRFAIAAGTSTLGLAIAQSLGLLGWSSRPAQAAENETFAVTHTEAEWRKLLDANQFDVLRREGTERPYTSPLNDEHRSGRFACAGCALELFTSATKFDSHTGWPSFWKPLDNAVGEHTDRSFGMARTEVHCSRCGGHLGHVFDDGPKPTGLRYCMNGVAMKFTPGAA